MSRNNNYTAGNLLDCLYHQKYYKLTGIDLSRQTDAIIPQQINFVGKLEKDTGTRNVSYCWKEAGNYSKIFLIFINCNRII